MYVNIPPSSPLSLPLLILLLCLLLLLLLLSRLFPLSQVGPCWFTSFPLSLLLVPLSLPPAHRIPSHLNINLQSSLFLPLCPSSSLLLFPPGPPRSEERRVGKESR